MNLLRKGLGAPTTELSGSARLACEKCGLNVRAGARRHVVARRHHFVTLRGVVTLEVCHAADGRNARRAPAARSLRANIQRVNGAHGGHVCSRKECVSGRRASALKLPDLCREKNDEGVNSFGAALGVLAGADETTGGDEPCAPMFFQFATGSFTGSICRWGVDPSRVVRPAGGFKGLTGFDVAGGSDSTVSAALDCRERRATYDCERQRGYRSGCGLSDAGRRGARVARRRHHTSWATRDRRLVADILTVVEAPTPRRHGPPVALMPATHVSESANLIVADRGSIPRGSTGLCAMARSASPSIRSERAGGPTPPRWWKSSTKTSVTGGESAATLQGRAVVARLAHNQEAAGSTPAPATIEAVPLVGGSTHGGSAGMNSCGVVIQRRRCRGSTSNALGETPTEGLRPSRSATSSQYVATKVAQAIEGTGAPGLPERTARIHPLERRATNLPTS